MKKHEAWLCERLPEWEAEGLVDHASAEKLRARYEKEAKPTTTSGNLAIFIVSAMGALLVGLGIIALFAANWAALSRNMRAFVSLIPLTLCSILALVGFARGWKAHAFWEALGICWTLAIWSGFGLVCQTYHLSDNVRGFVLACTLLCLPVLYLTHSAISAVAWPFYGLVWFLMDEDDFTPLRDLGYLAMLAAYLPVFVMIHRRIKFREAGDDLATRGTSRPFAGLFEFFGVNSMAVAVLSIIMASCDHWLSFGGTPIFLLASLWVGVSLGILAEYTQWRSMRNLGFLYLLPFILNAPLGIEKFHSLEPIFNQSMPVLLLFGALTVLVWAMGIRLLLQKGEEALPKEKRFLVALLMIGFLAAVFVYLIPLPQILMYLYLLAVAGLSLAHALRKLRLFQMNLSLGILIYEILVKYLASDWSFTAKGLILLVCGMALLFSNIFIIRGRRQAAKEVA